jgi:hypothetical protein
VKISWCGSTQLGGLSGEDLRRSAEFEDVAGGAPLTISGCAMSEKRKMHLNVGTCTEVGRTVVLTLELQSGTCNFRISRKSHA